MTKIIAGFPGVGKSYAYKKLTEEGNVVYDSDSSTFNKKYFPRNYIEHIKAVVDEGLADYIFVSTHKEVRIALIEEDIPFNIVFPYSGDKEVYLNRYKERGSPEAFIKLLDTNFEAWVKEIEAINDTEYVKKHQISGEDTIMDLLETADWI